MRIAERKLYGDAHIGHTQMRFDRAVPVLNHAVHTALRMHHDANIAGTNPKEMMSLYDLEPFVHKTRAVHSNLGAHVPCGMRQCLLNRDLRQLLARITPKRAARARKPDAARLTRVLAQIALIDGGVLAVHRQQRLVRCKRHNQISAHDQRLFVGQGELLAAGERVIAGAQASSTRQRVDHDVCILQLRQSRYGIWAKTHLCILRQLREYCGILARSIAQSELFNVKLGSLRYQLLHTRPAGKRHNLQLVWVHAAHIQRLRANRAGRAQKGDAQLAHR